MSDTSRLYLLRQRISFSAWVITLLLSLRGLFEFYGMKTKGTLEQAISYVTEPIVQLFRFDSVQRLDIPAISVLLAAVSILLLSYILQLGIKTTELRYERARAVATLQTNAIAVYLMQK